MSHPYHGLNELREMFLKFFETKGHLRLPSFSLVPQNDKSILLINAGYEFFDILTWVLFVDVSRRRNENALHIFGLGVAFMFAGMGVGTLAGKVVRRDDRQRRRADLRRGHAGDAVPRGGGVHGAARRRGVTAVADDAHEPQGRRRPRKRPPSQLRTRARAASSSTARAWRATTA